MIRQERQSHNVDIQAKLTRVVASMRCDLTPRYLYCVAYLDVKLTKPPQAFVPKTSDVTPWSSVTRLLVLQGSTRRKLPGKDPSDV